MAKLKPADEIKALKLKVRRLEETVEVYDLNYGWLADLVNDAACLLKDGKPIDQQILDGFVAFEWKEDGRMIPLRDCDRVTSFAARTRHAPNPRTPTVTGHP